MKNLYLMMLLMLSAGMVDAQNDTLLYENFDVDPTAGYALYNSGTDTTWVNFDSDGIPDFNNRPQEWFWSDIGFASVDTLDGCLYSSSWLLNYAPGNRNYLITPPIYISDANAQLHWKSAPRQTPRYIDGYTVMVSTTDNMESSFLDTLFRAAQFLSGSGNSWANYTFSSGFVHGLDGTYIEFDGDSGAYLGEQRPFTESLAAYAGQTIYIAFLHDADDDNLISLDDILVTGTLTSLNEVNAPVALSVYPNPSSNKIELSYQLLKTAPVSVAVYDISGKEVMAINSGMQIAGAQKLTVDISGLPSGSYQIQLNAGNTLQTRFVKQ